MKKITLAFKLVGLVTALALTACSSQQVKDNPVLNAVVDTGCAVEVTATQALGTLTVQQCGGPASAAVACGNAYQVAMGNINLCALPVAPSAQELLARAYGVSQLKAQAQWQKVGDITYQDLKAMRAQLGKTPLRLGGIVGNVVCPLVSQVALGFLTPALPPACACTQSLSAGSWGQLAVSACEAVVTVKNERAPVRSEMPRTVALVRP